MRRILPRTRVPETSGLHPAHRAAGLAADVDVLRAQHALVGLAHGREPARGGGDEGDAAVDLLPLAGHAHLLHHERHDDLAAAHALPAGRRLLLGHRLLEADGVADALAVVAPRDGGAVAGEAL